jgi:DNA adenine methylase
VTGEASPTRPALRWHGGKWRLAPWIISHLPPHRVYVEPFGGAASVLLRKPRSYAEVYNDLDGEVVELFRVLQDEQRAARLRELLILTPFARAEFDLCYAATDDPVERARRLVIRSFMGFGSNAHATTKNGRAQTGFRSNSNRAHTTPAQDWASYPDALPRIVSRIAGVVIENRDALAVMAQHDGEETLHYVDPPYQLELRNPGNPYDRKHMYRHELDGDGHARLLEFLPTLAGMVVLSGYPSLLYDAALAGWRRVERRAFADGARPRTEVLWLSPTASSRLGSDAPLLNVAAE